MEKFINGNFTYKNFKEIVNNYIAEFGEEPSHVIFNQHTYYLLKKDMEYRWMFKYDTLARNSVKPKEKKTKIDGIPIYIIPDNFVTEFYVELGYAPDAFRVIPSAQKE